jgi:hypothetical protein
MGMEASSFHPILLSAVFLLILTMKMMITEAVDVRGRYFRGEYLFARLKGASF